MSFGLVKILDDCVNKVVLIKLKNNSIIRGNLQAFDQHMNLVLTKSQDMTEDKVKNLDKIILRGDSILVVSLPEEK